MRCIKPNDQKSPTLFDEERCRHQVSYLGLLENVRVRRAGFAYRQPYHRFLLRYGLRPPSRDPRTPPPAPLHLALPPRYKMTCEYTWPNHLMATDREATQALLEQHGFQDDVAYGHTKVFIRTPRTLFCLEQERAQLIPIIVLLLQKVGTCGTRWLGLGTGLHQGGFFWEGAAFWGPPGAAMPSAHPGATAALPLDGGGDPWGSGRPDHRCSAGLARCPGTPAVPLPARCLHHHGLLQTAQGEDVPVGAAAALPGRPHPSRFWQERGLAGAAGGAGALPRRQPAPLPQVPSRIPLRSCVGMGTWDGDLGRECGTGT